MTSSNGNIFRVTGLLCEGSPVNSPHKGLWHGVLMFSLICAWINSWVNNGEAGDLRRHSAHYDVSVMDAPNCATRPWSQPTASSFPLCLPGDLTCCNHYLRHLQLGILLNTPLLPLPLTARSLKNIFSYAHLLQKKNTVNVRRLKAFDASSHHITYVTINLYVTQV